MPIAAASPAARLAALPPAEREALLAGLSPDEHKALLHNWRFWARPDQLPPSGDWRTWLFLAGRGAGKTRAASEWVRSEIEAGRRRQIGIVGPTAEATRAVMVEGPSGIIATSPPWCRPEFEPSNRRITWPNGAICWLFSGEEVDRLRGPNLDGCWVDEFCSFADPAALWPILNMALRIEGPLGDPPRVIVTTTPKPLPILKEIIADPTTVVTRAKTIDNRANLDAATVAFYLKTYGGTTLGRQELDGEILSEVEGALWDRQLIDKGRVRPDCAPRFFKRIVVAVDPAVSFGPDSDETGIIVAGLDHYDEAYILEDLSGRYSPERWGRVVVDAYRRHLADRVIAEKNQGGDLVESVLRMVDRSVPYRGVWARHGKRLRAEPVLALYEQRRVHHVGVFGVLEDQMCEWEPDAGGKSPDRVDALCYGLHELVIRPRSRLPEKRPAPVVVPIFAR